MVKVSFINEEGCDLLRTHTNLDFIKFLYKDENNICWYDMDLDILKLGFVLDKLECDVKVVGEKLEDGILVTIKT